MVAANKNGGIQRREKIEKSVRRIYSIEERVKNKGYRIESIE